MRLNLWRAPVLALALMSLGIGHTKAQTPGSSPDRRYVASPIWTSRPTAEDFARTFPPRMQTGPIGGGMTMICGITGDGRLSPCKALGEAPAGMGVAAAGLKLAAKFQMKNADGAGDPVSGRLVVVPISFRLAGKPVAQAAFSPAGSSVLIDPVREVGSAQTIDCPSADAPTRKCALRDFSLQAPNPLDELNRRVLAVGKVDGISRTICQVQTDSTLERCSAPENLTADQAKAFGEVIALLKAPEKTNDGTPLSGTVITDFDWSQIVAAIKVRAEFEATVLAAPR